MKTRQFSANSTPKGGFFTRKKVAKKPARVASHEKELVRKYVNGKVRGHMYRSENMLDRGEKIELPRREDNQQKFFHYPNMF